MHSLPRPWRSFAILTSRKMMDHLRYKAYTYHWVWHCRTVPRSAGRRQSVGNAASVGVWESGPCQHHQILTIYILGIGVPIVDHYMLWFTRSIPFDTEMKTGATSVDPKSEARNLGNLTSGCFYQYSMQHVISSRLKLYLATLAAGLIYA